MFPTLECQCEQGHTWETLVPKYWFSLKDCACPECSGSVTSMRWGDLKTIEQIRASMKVGCSSDDSA